MPLTDINSLLRLQELDLKLRDLESRHKLLPKEMKALIAKRDELLAGTAAAADKVRQVELAIKAAEGEAAKLEEENRKLQQQSSLVKKNTEYQAMLTAIDNNKTKIGEFEEKALLLLDDLEAAKKTALKTKEDNNNTIKMIKAEFDELFAFSKTVEQEISKLKAERPNRLCGIDPDTMSLYNRLLSSKSVRTPVSKVEDGVCGNCFLRVTPQCLSNIKRDKFTTCDNCQGLLYMEQEDND
ncbi:MAG: hypothetical protein IKC65_02910 [Lentisphaeria bacterium]|nr:hypothetical protein [Lentisphaeria bacterium]